MYVILTLKTIFMQKIHIGTVCALDLSPHSAHLCNVTLPVLTTKYNDIVNFT